MMLADAQLLLAHQRHNSAADRAYYAMFHAALAALFQAVPRLPTSHSGLRSIFGRALVDTRRVDRSLAKDLATAFNLRQNSTYNVAMVMDQAVVQTVVAKAEAFAAAMRQLLGVV